MRVHVKPNLVDRAVSFVSPVEGVRRMEARTRLAASSAFFGGSSGYKGANPDRTRRRGWFARARSANADTLPQADKLRAQQRDAVMNQPIATAAIDRSTVFTIGTGLMALPQLDATKIGLSPEQKAEWERRIAADHDAYLRSKDPDAERTATGYGLQDIVFRSRQTSGDIIALRVMPQEQPGRLTETAWKLAEADRLRNPPTVSDGLIDPRTNRKIAGGVEVDAFSAPVAYHILKHHPGDLPSGRVANPIPERIDAWDNALNLPRVLHLFEKQRPEQFRGVGMLATIMEPLRAISDLTDAELFAAVMTSMLAVIYKSKDASPLPEPDFSDGASDDGAPPAPDAPPPNYKLEPGTVLEIESDAEVDMKSPGRPNSAFDPFFQAIVRQIGAAIGIPGGVLLSVFNSSYTASKAELEVFYHKVRRDVAWMADNWCTPGYLCWFAEKVASGEYECPGFFADPAIRAAWTGVDWRGDGKISLNPYQEAQALKIHQDNGWQTGQQITAQVSGGNFRENIETRGAEHRAWLAEGLPVAVSPGAPAKDPGSDDGSADNKKKDQTE